MQWGLPLAGKPASKPVQRIVPKRGCLQHALGRLLDEVMRDIACCDPHFTSLAIVYTLRQLVTSAPN
jgi:hypothetical protein